VYNLQKEYLRRRSVFIAYRDLYETRAKNSWFAHIVEKTPPHYDMHLAKIRSFVAVDTKYNEMNFVTSL